MTSAAVVIAVVVGLGEAKNPSTVALLSAARESLAEGSVVRVVERASPNEVNAVSLERELGVGATVVVTWRDVQHALVRVHLPANDLWFSQQMDFSAVDTPIERGRTLGLVAASIWPDPGRARRPPPTAGATARSPAASSPAPDARAGTGNSGERGQSAAKAERQRDEPTQTPAPEPTLSERWVQEPRTSPRALPEVAVRFPREAADGQEDVLPEVSRREGAGDQDGTVERRSSIAPEPGRPHTYALELNSVGATGLGHPAEGLGAALRGTFFPASLGFGICAGFGARLGGVSIAAPADARDLEAQLALGVEWWPQDGNLRSGIDEARDTWALGLRVEALAVYHDVSDPRGESRSLILPGGEALVQVRLRLASRLHLLAAAGIEGIAGEIVIRRPSGNGAMSLVEVARIASVRAVGELGVRVTF